MAREGINTITDLIEELTECPDQVIKTPEGGNRDAGPPATIRGFYMTAKLASLQHFNAQMPLRDATFEADIDLLNKTERSYPLTHHVANAANTGRFR